MEKQRILIVDSEKANRSALDGMFSGDYETLPVQNGQEAIAQFEKDPDIALVLLDILMPESDGYAVLDHMKKKGMIDDIPVILIAGDQPKEHEDRAYDYKIADMIRKPFYPDVIKRRAANIIELYQTKRNMALRLREQERQLQATNECVIDTLSAVIEFRNLESSEHTRRVKYLTRVLLKYLAKYFPRYGMTPQRIDEIARASVLHDIGMISIPDAILLKPGKLTEEEFELVKTHTLVGCDILQSFREKQTDEFYRYCYEICRHHHERWDGNGYPDKLVGDEIPISAQIVSIVDVYDALVSERIYKEAYVNSAAYDMIVNGECGQFSPDVLECFELAKEDFFDIVEVIQMFDFSA